MGSYKLLGVSTQNNIQSSGGMSSQPYLAFPGKLNFLKIQLLLLKDQLLQSMGYFLRTIRKHHNITNRYLQFSSAFDNAGKNVSEHGLWVYTVSGTPGTVSMIGNNVSLYCCIRILFYTSPSQLLYLLIFWAIVHWWTQYYWKGRDKCDLF